MNWIRSIESHIRAAWQPGKVILLMGARRTGKTKLLQKIARKLDEPFLLLHGEDLDTVDLLARRSLQHYRKVMGKSKVLLIDEAQKIDEIGLKLKLMVDQMPDLKILVTGSSAFDLDNRLGEPLTGRRILFHLYPMTYAEWVSHEDRPTTDDLLTERLIYGNYPEVWQVSTREDRAYYLQQLVRDYLLKDILAFDGIRNSDKILRLLRLVAFQIGHEVSLSELGRQLSLDKNTVERYLHLLTQVFILFRVGGFSRNLRKEITKSSKWYFYDTGIRNALIANLNPWELRSDHGPLWENYIISERLKQQSYSRMLVNNYFWRTYDQQEIDWIEDRGGRLHAYEMKWNPRKKIRIPAGWAKAYPDSTYHRIDAENYHGWLVAENG